MKNKFIVSYLLLVNCILCKAQSVYMHEAQDETEYVSIKDIIYSLILIFIMYIVSRIIKSLFKAYSSANKSSGKRAEQHLQGDKPASPQYPIVMDFVKTYKIPTNKGTAPIRLLSQEERRLLHEITANKIEIFNGCPAVDLGLDILFSIKNLGANEIEDEGDMYSWGSIKPVRKSIPFSESEINDISLDELNALNIHLRDSYSGNSLYDPATALMGNGWRTPTISELGQLMMKCKWLYLDQDKIRGYKVIGPNGDFIFIPMRFDPLYHFGDIGISTNLLSSTSSEDSKTRMVNGRNVKCAKHLSIKQYPREIYPTLKIDDIIRPMASFIRPVITSPYIRSN